MWRPPPNEALQLTWARIVPHQESSSPAPTQLNSGVRPLSSFQMTYRALLRTLSLIVCAATVGVARICAQTLEPSVALGVAVPTGGLSAQRTAGPLVRGAVTFGDRQRRHVRLRLELEGAWLVGGERRAGSGSWSAGTFRAISGLATLVVGARGSPAVAPYLIVGMGLQRMAVSGATNPYGMTFGVRGGAGLQWRVGKRTVFAEVSSHAAATDFGTTSDFSLATYVPITIGIRF